VTPLEAVSPATDRTPVSSRVSSGSREGVIQSQIGKLTECDKNLSVIASEMTLLQDELTQFHADADKLARLLSDREASLNEKELALSRLEEECTLARKRADGASAELREAAARLSQRDERVATLEQELQALQTGIDERERRLADAAAELSGVRDALAERERTLEQERAIARTADNEIADWRRRSAGLLLELASATADQKQFEAAQSGQDEVRVPEDSIAVDRIAGHVRFIALPKGYSLSESEEPCSRPGDFVDIDGRHFLVARIGRSPLPGDARPCAFLFPGQ
jgi:chromosome segregation ATPase